MAALTPLAIGDKVLLYLVDGDGCGHGETPFDLLL
jgi:hypothetical protein